MSGGGARIATGLDRLLAGPAPLAGRRYGLLGHAASLTADLRPAHLALAAAGHPPAALFGPEHGYYGVEQDMVAAAGGVDRWTGARLLSLYGDDEASLVPSPAAFDGLDLLLIDLQDVGSRYYTYAATAVWVAEVALAAGCEVWLLDRPNPLGGLAVEGNLPEPGYGSFVSAFELPVRHGLTLGELFRLEADRRGLGPEGTPGGGAGWRVWRLAGWERGMLWDETGRPWVAPSPNMPSLTTALLYPGACLIEATELSEGRGTTRPFQLVGAPGVDPPALADELAGRLATAGVSGLTAVPTYFRPGFQKHAGALCGGVELVITDRAALASYRAGVILLAALRSVMSAAGSTGELAPAAFAWRRAPYEFVSDRPAIDLLTGGDCCRSALESDGGVDESALTAWIDGWARDEERFRELRRPYLLYPEEASAAEGAG